jgi:hypothetical protein
VKTNAISFTLTGPDATHPFTVVAAPKPAGKPEWGALKAFFVMLLAAAVLAIASLKRAGQGLSTELQYLDSAWSFNDSWVSNVTVIGGLLAGIFGSSDVVTALLGSDAKSSVALATVGVAVAAALVAAAPIILVITKGPNGFYTVYGLALAAVLTVSAAGGEVWVVYRSGAKLDLGGWQDYIVYFAIAALVLLGLYGFISLVSTVKDGTTQPPATVSDTLTGAAWIVGALTALHPEGRVPDLEYLVPKGGPPIPSVMAAAPTKPKRSALL